MDFSNRHTNEFVNLCDLENVLGGVSVCHAGLENGINTAVVNGVNVAISDCTGGNAGEEVNNSFNCRPELCLTAFSEISDFVKNVWFSTGPYQRGVNNFNVNTFLNQIYAFITGKILNIPDQLNHSPSTLQNDTKCMASTDHSRHCERSEAIQENGDLFRLLRRFTPRNDSNSSAHKKKAGVK